MFLAFWLLDEAKAGAAHVALVVFRHIFLLINKFIYQFIVFAYNIFIRLSNGQLLNSKEMNELFGRLALIIGLLMLFRVAIGFIQLLIEPDSISDSKKGLTGIVKKIILVIIMLGMSTYLFNLLTNIQVAVIKSNIIPKLLLPYEINDTDFGKTLSGNLFNSFIYEIGDVNAAKECTKENYKVAQKEVLVEQNFEYMGVCIDEYDDDKNEFIYEYNFVFSTLVGIAVAWFVFSYCVSVGIRLIQLTVLQIISPIGIIGYLSPKDETLFTNWLKKYMGTYLDIFIRLIIINFAVYLIALIFSGYGDKSNVFWGSIGETSSILEAAYIKIIMILAILSFAKKAPDLIKSLFPSGMLDSGIGFGIEKPGETLAPLGRAVGFGAGALLGTSMSAASRYRTNRAAGKNKLTALGKALPGALTGGFRGAIAGGGKGNMFKNIGTGFNNNREINNKYNDMVLSGGSTVGKFKAMMGDAFGESAGQKAARTISNYNSFSDTKGKLKKIARETDAYQDAERAADAYRNSADATAAGIERWNNDLKALEKSIINNGISGTTWNNISDNDRNAITEMQNRAQDLNSFAKSRNLEMIDENGNRIDQITNGDQLSASVDNANRIIGTEKSNPDYQKNKVNDRFAGNDTSKTEKK